MILHWSMQKDSFEAKQPPAISRHQPANGNAVDKCDMHKLVVTCFNAPTVRERYPKRCLNNLQHDIENSRSLRV